MDILYRPHEIEKIVQNYWEDNQTFSAIVKKDQEKFYCLSMLPYPSGNLHMGHVRNYTIGDVIARFQRMNGKNVLHPIGWDAFGLPAEQAAITHNINPENWTYNNIKYMKYQLKLLGFSYDWNRELITCNPQYYRWEQWFFTILYKKGLVYKKKALINWCSYHKTVLANEQVINNCCWRCNTPIKYKKISQWFIKITNYANQLLSDLNKLKNWPNQIKTMQKNWIGQSEELNIFFKIENSNNTISVYTKRPDLLMGITYITISINHPIALKLSKKNIDLFNFIKNCNNSLYEPNKKIGIFTKINAIHPLTNKKLPIWISNFVSHMDLDRTEATMSVPAHNQNDWEFAKLYNLPIQPVIKNLDGTKPVNLKKIIIYSGILCNSGHFNELNSEIASNLIAKILIKKKIAQHTIRYRLKDWCISRQRYWGVPVPIIHLKNNKTQPKSIDQLPVILPKKILNTNKSNTNNFYKLYINWIKNNYKTKNTIQDFNTFDTFMESSWYYARYTCPDYNDGMLDSDVANYWLPIDQYIGGIEHATMHLIYFRFYHKLMRDEGLINSDEPAINLLCQGMVLSDAFYYISHDGQRIWVSLDKIIKIKRDKKTKRILQAIDIDGNHLTHAGMCKMSKSKNNGIDPTLMIKKYGADSVRFFIMFAAPVISELEWKISGLEGAYRFLKRVWKLVYEHIKNKPKFLICVSELNDNQKFIRYLVHKTIEKVTNDISIKKSFNTALSEIMKLINILYDMPKIHDQDRAILQEALLVIIRLLYPFTPHISFILWKALGESNDIDNVLWPKVDLQAIQTKKTLIIVQINGKTKHKIYMPINSPEDLVYKFLKKEIILKKFFLNKKVIKIIYIPNKIINLLV